MAKKKKMQLKPVDRGFAVTSVPKKVIPSKVDADPSNMGGETGEKDNMEQSPDDGSFSAGQRISPDAAEEQFLQDLVDRLQEKTEKEIAR